MVKGEPETVPLHIRLPKKTYDGLLKRRDTLRKTNPMANLSDAARDAIDRGLKEKP